MGVSNTESNKTIRLRDFFFFPLAQNQRLGQNQWGIAKPAVFIYLIFLPSLYDYVLLRLLRFSTLVCAEIAQKRLRIPSGGCWWLTFPHARWLIIMHWPCTGRSVLGAAMNRHTLDIISVRSAFSFVAQWWIALLANVTVFSAAFHSSPWERIWSLAFVIYSSAFRWRCQLCTNNSLCFDTISE